MQIWLLVSDSFISHQSRFFFFLAYSDRDVLKIKYLFIVFFFITTKRENPLTSNPTIVSCVLKVYVQSELNVNVNVYVIGHSPSGLFRTNVNK